MHSNPVSGSRLERELGDRDKGKTPTTTPRSTNQGVFFLEIHKGLQKDLSSLVVQMRTGKIGLREFLYERRIPAVGHKGCDLCGGGEQTIHHMLLMYMTCSRFRADTWRKEEKEQYHHKSNADIIQICQEIGDFTGTV